MKYSMGFTFIVALDSMRHSWIVQPHSLMLVSWQKDISPSNLLRSVTFGVISTTE